MNADKRIVLILFLLWALIWPAQAQSPPLNAKVLCLSGEPTAPIRVEVFSDYQCPSCRFFYLETIKPLIKEFGSVNKVCIRYYDFPLRGHKFAFEASRYGVAARRLGRDQWQRVSEAFYENQSKWSEDGKFEKILSGVLSAEDLDRIKKFVKDPSIDQTINQEIALGIERQVNVTPTFFISGNGREKKVSGKVSYSILKDYLDRMMK